MYTGVRNHGLDEATRAGQFLIMGPWEHGGGSRAGVLEFPGAADVDLLALQQRWLDHHLRGVSNGVTDEPRVRIYIMGLNRWRDEDEWPLARTRHTRLYLHSNGMAVGRDGDGVASFEPPGDEPADTFVYDPADPVPTRGGNIVGYGAGAADQRELEDRRDVVVYTSAPLSDPLEITGSVTAEIHMASSARDTDLVVKVVDVHPDGMALNVVDGILRARYRNSKEYPEFLEPGSPARFVVDLWATSHVFLPGHRIRIDLTSSNFPRFDRNANSGLTPGEDVVLHTARQHIFHDANRPSFVVLPVIPQ
jgi:putative CocE/NonD family hydrolase